MTAVLLAWRLYAVQRTTISAGRTACAHCNYSLAGHDLPCICPECGSDCDTNLCILARPNPWKIIHWFIAITWSLLMPLMVWYGAIAAWAMQRTLHYPGWHWQPAWHQAAVYEYGRGPPMGVAGFILIAPLTFAGHIVRWSAPTTLLVAVASLVATFIGGFWPWTVLLAIACSIPALAIARHLQQRQ
jgi:hypothetical protein